MKGYFLYRHFSETQGLSEPNIDGEIQVRCPFPHNKGGLEQRASASVNIQRGLFKCFTCETEGRFHKGGMGELQFIQNLYNISYAEAVKFIRTVSPDTEQSWEKACANLLNNTKYREYLNNRGITDDLIKEYVIGYRGDGIAYPVFVNGICVDVRTYNPNPTEKEPKIRSKKDATCMIYPYDHWQKQKEKEPQKPTILNAGENDTLLNRSKGFNAITNTLGEGSIPKIFMKQFEGLEVIVLYDCDLAGEAASKRIAFYYKQAGAKVKIATLKNVGLTGEKDDKDITDYYIKHNGTAEELQREVLDKAIEFTDDMAKEQKDKEFPVIDLWDVFKGEYKGKRLSSRVMMASQQEKPLEIPCLAGIRCGSPVENDESCIGCPFREPEGSKYWELDEYNLDDVIPLVDANQQEFTRAFRRTIGLPYRCPKASSVVEELATKRVQKVTVIPDMESENELLGYKEATAFAYVLENEEGRVLDSSGRYRIYFKRYKHPKDQTMNLVVDRFEASDNSINTFEVDEDMVAQLETIAGHPKEVIERRIKIGKKITGRHAPEIMILATEIMYHSVLDVMYFGKLEKGHPEGLMIGAPESGKSSTVEAYQPHYGLGNIKAVKGASLAGLVGGAERNSNGTWQVTWGALPRNNGGLLVMDELSGLSQDVFKQMTSVRSKRLAEIDKIAKGRAPAKTRLLWISNPKVGYNGQSRMIADYSNGVDIVLELVGSNEDVRRFDFIYIMPNATPIPPYYEDDEKEEEIEITDAYKNLVKWAWTRKPENILYDHKVERYIWSESLLLNKKFHAGNDLNILGAAAHKKLMRIAVSLACMCFSHDGTGENVLVKKEHVDFAVMFLNRCYDNDVFRLVQYAQQEKAHNETNEDVVIKVANMARTHPMIMKTLATENECNLFQLQTISGLDRDEFNKLVNQMAQMNLIKVTSKGVYPTGRFRKSVALARKRYEQVGEGLKPLAQQGGMFL